jgi:hypothetical protein
MQLPLIQGQAQDVSLLGVSQRGCGKRDKTLQAKGIRTPGKHASRILWLTRAGIAEKFARPFDREGVVIMVPPAAFETNPLSTHG